MKKKWYQSLGLWYGIGFIIALSIIFGLGKRFDPEQQKIVTTFNSQGITQFRKGMDIAGGVRLTYKVDFSKYSQIYAIQSERELAQRQAIGVILKNIDKRISALGVSDYSARQQNIDEEIFLVVEIGGVHSIETAKEIIGKTVELEFKVPAKESEKVALIAERKTMMQDLFAQIQAQPEQLDQLVAGQEANDVFLTPLVDKDIDTLAPLFLTQGDKLLKAKKGDIIQSEGIYVPSQDATSPAIEGYGLILVDEVKEQNNTAVSIEKFAALAQKAEKEFGVATGVTHTGTTGVVSYDTESQQLRLTSDLKASAFGGGDGLQVLAMYNISPTQADQIQQDLNNSFLISGQEVFINKNPQWVVAVNPKTNEILNGAFFSYAAPGVNQFGKPVISINFNDKGREIFCNLTKEFTNQQMAIFVGGVLQTAPVINEPICGGSAQIDGSFTTESAKELSDSLNEGALPAPLILSQEEKVSPVLGEGAINGAIRAAAAGLILMFLFFLAFYNIRFALIGLLVMTTFLVYSLAIFKLIDYAFSLSGIAAIILSLVVGVDGNIIIYERLSEELKTGKSWQKAIDDAYERSWLAIRDGNVTNIIVYIVLFGMGMSIFKGFGFAGLITGLIILGVNVPLTRILLKLLKK